MSDSLGNIAGGESKASAAANNITTAGAVRAPTFFTVAQTEVGSAFNISNGDDEVEDEVESENVV